MRHDRELEVSKTREEKYGTLSWLLVVYLYNLLTTVEVGIILVVFIIKRTMRSYLDYMICAISKQPYKHHFSL